MTALDQTATTTEPLRSEPARRTVRRARRRHPRTGLIGVEIGEESVQLAQVDSSGGVFCVRAAESLSQDFHPDLRGAGKAIRQVVRAAGFAGNDVACLLPPTDYQSDVVPPAEDDGRIAAEGLVRRFARRNASVTPAELVFDHWRVSGHDKREESGVQVVAVSRRTVEVLAAELHSAGFQIRCVDAPLTVAARAVRMFGWAGGVQAEKASEIGSQRSEVGGRKPEESRDECGESRARIPMATRRPALDSRLSTLDSNTTHHSPLTTHLVIDWQQATTSLTLVSQGTDAVSRSFGSTGSGSVVDAVARGFDIDRRHAAVLLRDYGLPGPGQTTSQARIATSIFGLVREPLRRLREEIERSLAYFRRQLGCGRPDRLFLAGSGSRFPHAAAWLSDELQIPAASCQVGGEFAFAAALSAIPFDEA